MTETETAIKFFREHLKIDNLKYGERQAIRVAIRALENRPVRCKDCKYSECVDGRYCVCHKMETHGIVFGMPLDGFCSNGEPREGKK